MVNITDVDYIGGDTATLVFRDDTGGFDAFGRAVLTDRPIPKANCQVDVGRPTEELGDAPLSVLTATGWFAVDADTTALSGRDAVVYQGRTYELQGPAVRMDDIDGNPEHVLVNATFVADVSNGELVIVQPDAARDDEGGYGQSGQPRVVQSIGVTPGNTAIHWTGVGTSDEAAFTVVFPATDPVADGDRIQVRNRWGIARVQTKLSQWSDRTLKVVLVQSNLGGA